MKFDYEFHKDKIAESAMIVENATLCGDVRVGENSSIWFNAVIRGDTECIQIGDCSNIQEHCLLHADPGKPCLIGDRVTIGHAGIVHGATIEDDAMVGIRATVLNDAVVGTGSLIAAGALVPERAIIPAHSVVMGIPGKIVRNTTEADRERIRFAADHYVNAAKAYRKQISS